MSIKIGNTAPKKVYIEGDEVKEVYVDSVKIRPSGWQPGANTIAYYPLTSATTVNDMSGNGHTLSQNGGTFGTYQGVNCLSLTATNVLSATISQLPQGNNPVTICCWCHVTHVNGEQTIFGYGRNSSHSCFTGDYWSTGFGIRTYYDDAVVDGTGSAYRDRWICLVGTSNGSQVKCYVNGQAIATASHSQNMQDTIFYIGGTAITGHGMTGGISKVIVENKAWTAQEVTDYFNLTKADYGIS